MSRSALEFIQYIWALMFKKALHIIQYDIKKKMCAVYLILT